MNGNNVIMTIVRLEEMGNKTATFAELFPSFRYTDIVSLKVENQYEHAMDFLGLKEKKWEDKLFEPFKLSDDVRVDVASVVACLKQIAIEYCEENYIEGLTRPKRVVGA